MSASGPDRAGHYCVRTSLHYALLMCLAWALVNVCTDHAMYFSADARVRASIGAHVRRGSQALVLGCIGAAGSSAMQGKAHSIKWQEPRQSATLLAAVVGCCLF